MRLSLLVNIYGLSIIVNTIFNGYGNHAIAIALVITCKFLPHQCHQKMSPKMLEIELLVTDFAFLSTTFANFCHQVQVKADLQTKEFRLKFSRKFFFCEGFDVSVLPAELQTEPVVKASMSLI